MSPPSGNRIRSLNRSSIVLTPIVGTTRWGRFAANWWPVQGNPMSLPAASCFRHLGGQYAGREPDVSWRIAAMRTQTTAFRLTARLAVGALLVVQGVPVPAMGQGDFPPAGMQDPQGGDPPARVGRLAQVSGTVSFRSQGDDQWNPAALNYPVTAGNAFWTEGNAEAVIEVGASRLTLAAGT